MNESTNFGAIIGAALLVCSVCGFVAGRWYALDTMRPDIIDQTDTVLVRDTVLIDSPVPVSEAPAGYEFVRIGTVRQLKERLAALEADADFWAVNPDTVYLSAPVEITRKTYKGEDYAATVSGWHPSLDDIAVYPKTVTVTTTRTVTEAVPYRWTVSPFVVADIGAGTFAARAGIMYDRQLRGGLRLFLGGGYELRNDAAFRSGPFAAGGVSFQMHP